jgi:hypothetical protein
LLLPAVFRPAFSRGFFLFFYGAAPRHGAKHALPFGAGLSGVVSSLNNRGFSPLIAIVINA